MTASSRIAPLAVSDYEVVQDQPTYEVPDFESDLKTAPLAHYTLIKKVQTLKAHANACKKVSVFNSYLQQ